MKSQAPRGDESATGFEALDDFGKQTIREFEKIVSELAKPAYLFRLFISGTSARSELAIQNIRKICEQYLAGQYELEVVDVYQQMDATKRAQVVAVPTLIKEFPLPPQRFVGDMSNTEKIVIGLKLSQ